MFNLIGSFSRPVLSILLMASIVATAIAQIRIPDDAPQPLAPADSSAAVSLPDRFALELIAAEPLIRNPSGVCWDERGRLFVCELHGYNMEGQYDIESLNKTGKLDRVVRRIPASQEAIEKAERDQTGTVKRLIDSDNDGVIDNAEIWADDLPACFGLVPARGGVIVVCSPHIIYLADRDDDGVAEVRETLFTGFRMGVLERRMSAPQWGPDGWIYVANGGGTIRGPHLDGAIEMPNNDFRFKADGSAIEPLSASTGTFGFAFSNGGDRYVISTGSPAIYVAPLPWRYLARNPSAGFGRLTVDVGPGPETYPTSRPHPWRSRRATDPGFEELFRTRYGATESTPNGFFTSACSPLVYNDTALPLAGQLLACEPAQNMIHRSLISRDGLVPQLKRPASEQRSEFLASKDIWFHPIAMSHAPDGAVVISDFYREIIEDYSAIPRYLQQEYQLKHGEQHGRLWRLVHRDMPPAVSPDMSQRSVIELVDDLSSERFWRRQTAKRLLIERADPATFEPLRSLITKDANANSVIAALHILDELGQLTPIILAMAIQHDDPAVVIQAMRVGDRYLKDPELLDHLLTLVTDDDPRVLLQLALSLGETNDWRATQSLAMLAMQSVDIRWMDDALLSSLGTGAADLMGSVLQAMNSERPTEAHSRFLSRLAKMIVDRRDDRAISEALMSIFRRSRNVALQRACLQGMQQGFASGRAVELSEPAETELRAARNHNDPQIANAARFLVIAMKIESAQERLTRIQALSERVADVQLTVESRIAAVRDLADQQDDESARLLLLSFGSSTPTVRETIMDALFSRAENQSLILAAIESKQLPVSALSAVQREIFLKHDDDSVRTQAETWLAGDPIDPSLTDRFVEALSGTPDPANGHAVFKRWCSNCHKVQGIGFNVGPDLVSEFQRSEETFIQDVLAPAAKITAGYETYMVQTVDGAIVTGLMSAESPTSITLSGEQGKSQTILRKDIEAIRVSETSLMPEELAKQLKPRELADVIAWLKRAKP